VNCNTTHYRANLNNVIFTCDKGPGGFCTLNEPCSKYKGFTDALSFYVLFEGQQNYIIITLSNFAVDTPEGTCNLYI